MIFNCTIRARVNSIIEYPQTNPHVGNLKCRSKNDVALRCTCIHTEYVVDMDGPTRDIWSNLRKELN